MDLNEITVFIEVVRAGSFGGAAQILGMPNSTVSSKVSSLEKRLGTTLITRTTRRLNITPVGQAYFDRCILGLEEISSAEAALAAGRAEPQGLLRVTAPVDLGSKVLPDLVIDYTRKFPKVNVEFILTDRRVDLIAENIDLAIRAGDLKDSTLIAKKLGSAFFSPFASPKYLKVNGTPAHPRNLQKHQCMHFTPVSTTEWKLKSAKGLVTVPLKARVTINDLNMLKNLAAAGNGIALLPMFFCYSEVQSGQLVRILPEWHSGLNPVNFVYPAQKFVNPKLSSFIELGTERIRTSLLKYNESIVSK